MLAAVSGAMRHHRSVLRSAETQRTLQSSGKTEQANQHARPRNGTARAAPSAHERAIEICIARDVRL
jgi:hypothetical protein